MPFIYLAISDYGTTSPPLPAQGYTTAVHRVTLSGNTSAADPRENPTVGHVADSQNPLEWEWVLHIYRDGTANFLVRAPEEYDLEGDFSWSDSRHRRTFVTPARLAAWRAGRELQGLWPAGSVPPAENAPSVWDHLSQEDES